MRIPVVKSFGKDLAELGNSFWKLNFQAVIKSAANAASPTAWGAPGRRLGKRTAGLGVLPKPSGRLR